MHDGGAAPAILNAANEVAVDAFLQGKIGFTRIAAVVDTVLGQSASAQIDNLEAVMTIGAVSRDLALAAVTKNQSYLSD